MMYETPIVLERVELLDFFHYMLEEHTSPSTVVVCSSKETFLDQMRHARSARQPTSESDNERDSWTIPALRLLASSCTVKLAFCPDLTHLRAYLVTHAYRTSETAQPEKVELPGYRASPVLAVLNPIELHRPTSAFSVQGLNRTFAAAVDAAYSSGSRLLFAECARPAKPELEEELHQDEDDHARNVDPSPWDQEVSMLNVTTKSFGIGERGWVGRTVTIRAVAGRWCRFEQLPQKNFADDVEVRCGEAGASGGSGAGGMSHV